MARIRLREAETHASRLPDVCMACGEASETHVKKNFRWYPSWVNLLIFVGLLPALIVMLVLTKQMSVEIPFCDRHRRYFGMRVLWIILALAGFITVWLAASAIVAATAEPQDVHNVPTFIAFTFVLSMIVSIITIAIIQGKTIRPDEITDREITLIRVNKEFIDALQDMRDARRDRMHSDDEFDGPRRRRDEDNDRDLRDPPRRGDAYRADPPRDRARHRERRVEDED